MNLTYEEEVFCREIVMTGSYTDAFIAAFGEEAKAMTRDNIVRKASARAGSAKIQKRLEELRQSVAKTMAIDKARVLEEIASIALFDPADLIGDNGEPLPMSRIPRHARAAIKSIEYKTELYTEIDGDREVTKFTSVPKRLEFWPKSTALDQLSKHLGLYAADNDQKSKRPLWENIPREARVMLLEELKKVAKIGSNEQSPGVDREPSEGAGPSITH